MPGSRPAKAVRAMVNLSSGDGGKLLYKSPERLQQIGHIAGTMMIPILQLKVSFMGFPLLSHYFRGIQIF